MKLAQLASCLLWSVGGGLVTSAPFVIAILANERFCWEWSTEARGGVTVFGIVAWIVGIVLAQAVRDEV